MLKKLKNKVTGKKDDEDGALSHQGSFGGGHNRSGSFGDLHRTASFGTSNWSRRKRRRCDPNEKLVRQVPANPEGAMNPMNIFDYCLVSSGWPKLILPGCPIPHGIYTVSDRVPSQTPPPSPAPIYRPSIVPSDAHQMWVAKLMEFYSHYAPEKAARNDVDELLNKCYERGATPEALFEKILEKYQKTEANWRPINWKQRLTRFYTIHDEDKLGTIPEILAYSERGGDLNVAWEDMMVKYGVNEKNWDVVVDWRARFMTFYHIHAPEKIPGVDEILQRLADTNRDPAALWVTMLSKYKVRDELWWLRSDDEIVWFNRLTAFYSLHAPEKMSRVSEILQVVENKGSTPDLLWPVILQQYDLTEDNWFLPRTPEATEEPDDSFKLPDTEADPQTPHRAPRTELTPEQKAWEEKLTKLFTLHSPDNVGLVQSMLEEEDLPGLWEAMLETFEVKEDNWDNPPETKNGWDRLKLATKVANAFKGAGLLGKLQESNDQTPRQRRRSELQPLAPMVQLTGTDSASASGRGSPLGSKSSAVPSPLNNSSLSPNNLKPGGGGDRRSPRSPAPRSPAFANSPRTSDGNSPVSQKAGPAFTKAVPESPR